MASIKGPFIKAMKLFTQVASLAGGRTYPNKIPQGESNIPCVVVSTETVDRRQRLDGFDDSLVMEEFVIRVYAWDSQTATTIGSSIPAAIQAIEGTTITDNSSLNGRLLGSVYLIDEEDGCQLVGENSDRLMHYYQLQVQIEHLPAPIED